MMNNDTGLFLRASRDGLALLRGSGVVELDCDNSSSSSSSEAAAVVFPFLFEACN